MVLIELIRFDLTGTKLLELDGNSVFQEKMTVEDGARYDLVDVFHRSGPLLFKTFFHKPEYKFFFFFFPMKITFCL